MDRCPLPWRLSALLLGVLLGADLSHSVAQTVGPTESKLPFAVGPIKADPVRNLVYIVDATNSRLLAIDMTTGQQVYAASIDDGDTRGELAVSIDDSTLYLSESGENEIMAFSLPSLQPLPTIPLDFSPESMATAVNGRLFTTESTGQISNVIVEVSSTTGGILNTFGASENYYYQPLIRTNTAGTNLYAGTQGISGYLSLYKYSLTGSQISAATAYPYEFENMIDFEPDEAEGRIYVMNGGIYGISVLLTANDNSSTVWPFTGSYGVGVAFNSQSNVVFGASGDPYSGDIREFNRTTGAPLADFIVGTHAWPIQDRGIAATADGNVLYVRSMITDSPTTAVIGFIGSLTQRLTLYPTIPQTITFPPLPYMTVGETTELDATDSLGLPITYTLLSGPAILSGNKLTITGAGTVVLAASQRGNLVDKPTQATITLLASLNSQSIAPFSPIANQTLGGSSFTITRPVASSGLPVAVSIKSGPATHVGLSITLTGAGVVTIAADQTGNATYSAAAEVTTSFVVSKRSQYLAAFRPIATQIYGEAPFAIFPPGSSSGLPTTVTVQSGPATIVANKVTLTGAGTVVLAANQAGSAYFDPAAAVTTSFAVNPASQRIAAFVPVGPQYYSPVPFVVAIPLASSHLPVTVTVVSGPATISGNLLTLTGLGPVELAANQPGNANYNAAAQVTTSFNVSKSGQRLSAFQAIAEQTYGGPSFSIVPPTSNRGLPVTVTVASGPATIMGDTVSTTGAGTVELVANQAGNSNYLPAVEVGVTFVVGKASQTLSPFSSIPSQSYGAAPFAVTPPTASSGLPVNVIVWSGPARISNDVVTPTGVGTVVLAAGQPGNANYNRALDVTATFTVAKNTQTLGSFDPIAPQTFREAPFAVAPPVASSGLPVTLRIVSGPATILANMVTVLGAGTVELAASQAGNADFGAAPPVTTSFTVNKAAQTIAPFAAIPTKNYGAPPFLIAVPKVNSTLSVMISVVSGPAIVVGNKVTLTGSGTVVLAANQSGGANYSAAAEVTTSFVVN